MKRLLFATVTMALISGTAYAMPGHAVPGMGGPGAHFGHGLSQDPARPRPHTRSTRLPSSSRSTGMRARGMRHAFDSHGRAARDEADPFDEEAIRAAFKGVAGAGGKRWLYMGPSLLQN